MKIRRDVYEKKKELVRDTSTKQIFKASVEEIKTLKEASDRDK